MISCNHTNGKTSRLMLDGKGEADQQTPWTAWAVKMIWQQISLTNQLTHQSTTPTNKHLNTTINIIWLIILGVLYPVDVFRLQNQLASLSGQITLPLPIMENWNQDHPERCSNFYGLYIKFQGCGKWPWTWWGQRKGQGHRPHRHSHGKWQKACINICKHKLKFSNCVLVRVPINNNNYEQLIALSVIILAKNNFTNHHGVI